MTNVKEKIAYYELQNRRTTILILGLLKHHHISNYLLLF